MFAPIFRPGQARTRLLSAAFDAHSSISAALGNALGTDNYISGARARFRLRALAQSSHSALTSTISHARAVSDISADGGGAVLFTSPAGAPASMPGVPPVTLDFNFLGRTWRLVVSPSQTLADATNAALLTRSVTLGVPSTICAAICSVIIAIFVRRNRREAREGTSFEAYVRRAP